MARNLNWRKNWGKIKIFDLNSKCSIINGAIVKELGDSYLVIYKLIFNNLGDTIAVEKRSKIMELTFTITLKLGK